ncbi:MAG: tetratricopeptide repeat-containing sensor histidine kinase [Cyclobacteriaceae bacterium]
MSKIGLICWCLLAMVYCSYGQYDNLHFIDSERNIISQDSIDFLRNDINNQDDSTRLSYLTILIENNYENDLLSTLAYCNEALLLAAELDNPEAEVFTIYYLVRTHRRLGNYRSTVSYLYDLINRNIAAGDSSNLMVNYRVMANTFANMENYEESERFAKNSINIAETLNNTPELINGYVVYGRVLGELGKYDSGIYFENRALDLLKEDYEEGNKVSAYIYNNLGRLFYLKNDYTKALQYYDKSDKIPASNKTSVNSIYTHYGITEVYIALGEIEKALNRVNLGIELALRHKFNDLLSKGYLKLSEIYQLANNYQNALEAQQLFKIYNDSIYSTESLQYIKSLNLNHKINELEIGREKQKEIVKILQENNELLQNQLFVRNLALVLGVALILTISGFSFFLYAAVSKKNRANEALLSQKKDLADTNQRLVNTQSQLIQTERSVLLGSLISGLSHGINNPLNYISGSARLLLDYDVLIGQLKDFVRKSSVINGQDRIRMTEDLDEISVLHQNILEGSDKITAIMKNLNLLNVKPSSGSAKYDINALLDESLVELSVPRNVSVEKHYQEELLIEGSYSDIKIVFYHILQNAVNAIVEKGVANGSIDVVTERREGQCVISIKDNGIGIRSDDQQKVFNPFYSTDVSANGLGLSIAYGLLIKNNGSIELISDYGQGTEIIVRL